MSIITFEEKAIHRSQAKQSMHRRTLSARIRRLFSVCDEEAKGYVTREDLFRLTNEIALTEEEVNNAFYYLDKDKNGSLSLEEFLSGFDVFLGTQPVSSKSFNHREISDSSQMFDYIDKDGKGFITKDDLQIVADELILSQKEIDSIFLALNKQGRSVLTFQDFKEGLENLAAVEERNEAVAMDEEVFTNGIDGSIDLGDSNMDYADYGQDELKAILSQKAAELFKACDKNGKGYITQEDLLELTRELALSTEQVQSAFIKLDKDKNKFLTLDEFIEGFGVFLGVENEENHDPEMERRQQKAKELFDLCDNGSKGYVTKVDLMRLTKDLGLTKDQLDMIFDQLDDDQNGFLTIYEFMHGFSEYLEDSCEEPSDSLSMSRIRFGSENDGKLCSGAVFEKQQSVEQMDSTAKLLISNIDEYIGDSLTKEQLAELWNTLQRTDTRTLTRFEEFLINITSEIKKAKLETVHLENTLKRKSLSHDIEVQKLYEEMEQQIKNEKAKVNDLEARREKMIREEMKIQLQDKDYQLNKLMSRQRELEERLLEVKQHEQNLKQENMKLTQQNSELEEKLNCSISSLEDTRQYVSNLQASTTKDKRDRIRAAMQASQGMQKEHESLIRQLDMLREMNQKLKDDKDAIESSMKMRADRTTSLDDELQMAQGKLPLQKSGSIMSNYFTTSKRGRQNSNMSGRTRNLLEKQGSLMSSYFEPSGGSQESLVYSDIPMDEVRSDLFGEEDPPDWKKRTIKAVEEDGELMLGDTESLGDASDNGTVSTSFSTDITSVYNVSDDGDHDIATSTPIRAGNADDAAESPIRRRRLLPTMHGGNETLYNPKHENEDVISHIKELRRKLSNEHELNERTFEARGENGHQGFGESVEMRSCESHGETDEEDSFAKANGVRQDLNGRKASISTKEYGVNINCNVDPATQGESCSPQVHTPGASEDQMSATESEADGMQTQGVEEELKEVLNAGVVEMEESKQNLREMLNELATPSAQQNMSVDETDKDIQQTSSTSTVAPIEVPPSNPNRVYKVVFVGDSGVGKSSLIHRFCFNHFRTNFSATIGVDFQVKIIKVFQEWVALQLWDTAGQERFRSITKQYFRKADGVIVMFDLCSETSFKNMRNWLNSVEDSAEPECSVMVLGNKLDLAEDGFRKIKENLAQKLAQDFNSLYFEVSAKSGNGVNEAMVKMARLLAEKEDSLMKMSVLNLDINAESKKKKACCS